jgi:hypothetical protein
MALKIIFSFLTYPRKGKAPGDPVEGISIAPDDGKLSRMLIGVFEAADKECNIPVMFTADQQHNPVRTELLALLKKPSVANAAVLAERLQQSTTGTSGIGLLFVCLGDDGVNTRIVISRFPADEGVVAKHGAGKLTVEFVDQVFLKSAFSYKSATYLSTGKPGDMWKGHAVDKQTNQGAIAADYWIVDFLKSEFTTTPATGTKRLALALKEVARTSMDPVIRREIVSAVQLAANMPKNSMSIADFCNEFHLSQQAKEAVAAAVNPPRLLNDKFKFDKVEFARHISYKQVELDNGAVLAAPVEKFDDCFTTVRRQNALTFSTTGEIVEERLRTLR